MPPRPRHRGTAGRPDQKPPGRSRSSTTPDPGSPQQAPPPIPQSGDDAARQPAKGQIVPRARPAATAANPASMAGYCRKPMGQKPVCPGETTGEYHETEASTKDRKTAEAALLKSYVRRLSLRRQKRTGKPLEILGCGGVPGSSGRPPCSWKLATSHRLIASVSARELPAKPEPYPLRDASLFASFRSASAMILTSSWKVTDGVQFSSAFALL